MAKHSGKSRARFVRWVAAALLLASVSGAVVLALAVSAGWQREELTRNVELWARDALGLDVSIDSLEGPLYPNFSARGLRLGADDQLLAVVDALSVEWSFSPGWPVSIEIHRVELEAPRLSLRRLEDGSWNLPSDDSAEPLSFWVDSLVWSDAEVQVDAASADPPWSLALVSQGSLESVGLPWSRAGALTGDLQVDFQPTGSAPLVTGGFLRVERRAGQPLRIDGAVDSPAGHATLAASGVWPSPDDDALQVDARVRLDFQEIDASLLPAGTPVPTKLFGSADLTATGGLLASGLPERVTFSVDLQPSRVGDAQLESAAFDGEINERWWKVKQGRAEGQGIALEATGSGQGDRLAALGIELRLDSLETVLKGWSEDTSISGRVAASAQLAGPVGKPSGALTINARDLTVQGLALGELVGRFRVEGGSRAEIEEMRLSGGVMQLEAAPGGSLQRDGDGIAVSGISLAGSGQSLTVDGWISPDEMRDVAVQVSRADVTTWARLFSLESQPRGVVTGVLRADGPLNDPTARVEFDWTGASWEDSELGVFAGNATARSGRIDLEATLRAGEQETFDLTGGAVIPSDVGDIDAWLRRSADRLEVRGHQVNLARVAPFLPDDVRDPSGTVNLTLAVAGGRDRKLTGWVEVAGGSLDVVALDRTFGPVQGRVAIDDTTLRIEQLSIGDPGAQGVLDGSVVLDDELMPTAVDVGLTLDAFPVERVPLPRSDDEDPVEIDTGGRVDADLRLTGSASAPRLAGTLDWVNPRWRSVVLERITADFEGSPDRVEATARMFYASREIANVQVSLPVPEEPDSAIDWFVDDSAMVQIRGDDLDFALLEPFLPRLVRNPRGLADVEVNIVGGTPEPQIEGTVAVWDGAVDVPTLRQTYSPIKGRARFDGHLLTIESIEVGSDSAGARIAGEIELVDLRPASADLSATLAGFPLARSPLLRADVDGAVQLTGTVEAPVLTGDLVLQNTRLTVRDENDPALKEVRIAADSRSGSVQEATRSDESVLDGASVNVSLRVPRNTWIRTDMLDLDVEGRGRITKRPLGTTRVAGSLSVVRGTVRLELRRFVVRTGTATLDGGRDADPLLDVEAIYPVADVVVVAYLTGRASAPHLRLASEPPLPEDDVVAYLIFGRPASQLGASEQGGVNAAAAGLAAGLALAELRAMMGDQFPVDTIDLTVGGGDQPSRFEVGRYVGRDLFVRYGQSFGPESQQEIGVSYRLNENFTLESTTSSDAAAGVDLFWSIEY